MFGIVTLLVIGAVFAMPFGEGKNSDSSNGDGFMRGQGMNRNMDREGCNGQGAGMELSTEEREEHMSEMDAAIASGYDAWKAHVDSLEHQPRIVDFVNEGNFDTFVAMHTARMNGDFDSAHESAKELGFTQKFRGLRK